MRVWKERYEESQKLQQNLEVNLRKAVDAAKKFGQRNPEEILAQLEDLRRQNNELDQKLAERPTEAAARRLEDLEAQEEQWEAERFRPSAIASASVVIVRVARIAEPSGECEFVASVASVTHTSDSLIQVFLTHGTIDN